MVAITVDVSYEVLAAIENTDEAKLTASGLRLSVVRYQVPEQSGQRALRTAVFFLPEPKSPYQRYFTTGKRGYGGPRRYEGRIMIRRPLFVRGAAGGAVPKAAYDAIEGRGSFEVMRSAVLKNAVAFSPWGGPTLKMRIGAVGDVLRRFGGSPRLAEDIVRFSGRGNTLAYAIQENIVAHAVRRAGYDAVVGYTRIKGGWRLSEVMDVRRRTYPIANPRK